MNITITKTLKEFLRVNGVETVTEYDRDGIVEALYIPNSHGCEFRDRPEDKFEFCEWRGKVLVRKCNIGHFQCRFIPWKGEHPTEMYFNFEYI
jgi:hypothetical protein